MTLALGLIDMQRGFMPASEGERLGLEGFGELPVPDGHLTVEPALELVKAFDAANLPIFTTQDWHPEQTGHFSANPDYANTWPTHCVAGTPGARLHPSIDRATSVNSQFYKGEENLVLGEYDTSYSGYTSHLASGRTFEQWAEANNITEVMLGGLALDYCVIATAMDLGRNDINVTIVIEATRPVSYVTGTLRTAIWSRNFKFVLLEDALKEIH